VKEKMKKINSKGFTLIELLAVITIMGILMLVAIPAVSRTIENSRRDTFMNTAKSYVNAIKNAVAADELYVGTEALSAKPAGYYYYQFTTRSTALTVATGVTITATTATDLMEQGGKSSWGNSDVTGVVAIHKTVGAGGRTSYEYAVAMVDTGGRGFQSLKLDSALKRSDVATSGIGVTDANLKTYLTPTQFPNASGTLVALPAGSTYQRITSIA